ncbi:hypothetical protein B0H16DRAFT_1740561 [Mycena metata]|uniref:Uncharacterized protein n=1 Tax=Mycena metata TaxID=1033252 RepID=A0AAD7MHR2_9AGAR|nr:hypothetical protein B0H16DRAFT_1740561 [Mycena metata]
MLRIILPSELYNTNTDTDDDDGWLATPDTMGTLVAQPNTTDVDAAFKDHLLAVLSLHDAPRAAAVPIPRYMVLGDNDTDTDTEGDYYERDGECKREAATDAGASGTAACAAEHPAFQWEHNEWKRVPDPEALYNTALEDDVDSTDTTTNSPALSTSSTSNNGAP